MNETVNQMPYCGMGLWMDCMLSYLMLCYMLWYTVVELMLAQKVSETQTERQSRLHQHGVLSKLKLLNKLQIIDHVYTCIRDRVSNRPSFGDAHKLSCSGLY